MKKDVYLFMVFLVLISIISFGFIIRDYQTLERHSESDLNWYVRMSESLLGRPVVETPRDYQYPPFYPLFLIPGILSGHLMLYILVFNAVFSILVYIASVCLARVWLSFWQAGIVGTVAWFMNWFFLTPGKSYGYPFLLTSLLFTLMFLMLVRGRMRMASILYMLMVGLTYSAWFLVPFLVLWHGRRIVKAGLFLLPASLVFLCWGMRNYLLHQDFLGGYRSVFNSVLLDVQGRLPSLWTTLEVQMVVLCLFVFILGCLTLRHMVDMGRIPLLLTMNFIVFFVFAGFVWRLSYISWRYLVFLLPVYWTIGVLPAGFLLARMLPAWLKKRVSAGYPMERK